MRPKSGRPHLLSAEQEADIINRLSQNPFLTAASFAREFRVHVSAISAVIRSHGLKCRTAAKKLRLTPEQCINRIAFCEIMLEQWDQDKLNSIIFSDEKLFCTEVMRKTRVYRPDNTRYDAQYMIEQDQSGRITSNYWGAIGYEGPVTPIVRIVGRFNSNHYLRILKTHVTPIMNRFMDDGDPCIFMQDNAPTHTAAIVMNYFSRRRYEVMEWPPKSPDLNPIENLWGEMERDWPVIVPRNEDRLNAVVQERWRAQSPRKIFLLKRRQKFQILCNIIIAFRILSRFISFTEDKMRKDHCKRRLHNQILIFFCWQFFYSFDFIFFLLIRYKFFNISLLLFTCSSHYK